MYRYIASLKMICVQTFFLLWVTQLLDIFCVYLELFAYRQGRRKNLYSENVLLGAVEVVFFYRVITLVASLLKLVTFHVSRRMLGGILFLVFSWKYLNSVAMKCIYVTDSKACILIKLNTFTKYNNNKFDTKRRKYKCIGM